MSPGKPAANQLRIRGANDLIISMESGHRGTSFEYFSLGPYVKGGAFIRRFRFNMPEPFRDINAIRNFVWKTLMGGPHA